MKMLEVPEYVLLEIHEFGERRLGMEEKPLLGMMMCCHLKSVVYFPFSVQLNWHKDDRDGRFLLRSLSPDPVEQKPEPRSFKRSFSVRMKKVFAKERKTSEDESRKVLEKSTPEHGGLRRSMTNPDSVLERRKIQKPFKPSPLRLKPGSSSDEDSGFASSGHQPHPSILVKIHSELTARNIPLLVVRLAPLDTTEEILEHVTTKYGLPATTVRVHVYTLYS